MAKIQILHISHTDIRGDSRIQKELVSLAELECAKVLAIGLDGGDELAFSTIAHRDVALHVVKKPSRQLTNYSKLLFHFSCFIALCWGVLRRTQGQGVSAVHCHDVVALPIGVLISLSKRCPLIYDAHELESAKNGQSKIEQNLTRIAERLCWWRVAGLVTVSQGILNWYMRHFPEKPSALVLNAPTECLEDALSEPAARAAAVTAFRHDKRNELGISKEALVCIYVGFFVKGRGIERILAMAEELENLDTEFVFLGDGPLRAEIEIVARAKNNVHMLMPVEHDQVVKVLSVADVGLCLIEAISLSDIHSLPNKLFEYAGAGLYVLTSDLPDMRDFVTEHNIGEVLPEDVSGLVQCLKDIRQKMANREVQDPANFLWEKQGQVLQAFYERHVFLNE